MENRTSKEEAAYQAGYRKGWRRGVVGALLGAMFATVAYDVVRDVAWTDTPSQVKSQRADKPSLQRAISPR